MLTPKPPSLPQRTHRSTRGWSPHAPADTEAPTVPGLSLALLLIGLLAAPAAAQLPPYLVPETDPPLRPYVAPPLAPKAPPKPPPQAPTTVPVPDLPPPPDPRFEAAGPLALTIAHPAAGTTLAEGSTVRLVWNTGGRVAKVKVSYEGDLCPLGGKSRGRFAKDVATVANQGFYSWKVPWMDTTRFRLKVVGYSAEGRKLTYADAPYAFLPLVCQNRPATAVCVSKAHQRLYYLRDGVIRRMHIVSTAAPGYYTPTMRPGSYDRSRGAMGKVFYKSYAPVSRMYEVVMYHWLAITSSGSHGIHATSPSYYGRLGRPASHGCIRQHRADARILWEMVSVGTPVYVM